MAGWGDAARAMRPCTACRCACSAHHRVPSHAACRDTAAAHSELAAQHRALQEGSQGLAARQHALEAALAAWQQRAQQAEALGAGLRSECAGGRLLLEAAQEEAERLTAELLQASVSVHSSQLAAARSLGTARTAPHCPPLLPCLALLQEREQAHRLQAGLAKERQAGARQRAALQGRGEELASLLEQLDQYSTRIARAEVQLKAARAAAEEEAARRAAAEEAAAAAAHQNVCLHASLADLAAAEQAWQQRAEQAEAGLAAATRTCEEQRRRLEQQEQAAAASRHHTQQLQASLAERTAQLEAPERQGAEHTRQLAGLQRDLQAAAERHAAATAAIDELVAAKLTLERSLHKQTVLAQQAQEQGGNLRTELQATNVTLAAAQGRADELGASLDQERAEHRAAAAAQEQAHEQRRAR